MGERVETIHEIVARYGNAFIVAIVALALRVVLEPWLHNSGFVIFLAAILAGAWLGGIGPALLFQTFLLFAQATLFAAERPGEGFTARALVGVGAYYLVGIVVGWLSETRGRAFRRISQQDDELRATIAVMGDGLFVVDACGRIESMNRMAEQLTGYQASDVIGQRLDTVLRIESSFFAGQLQAVLTEGRPVRQSQMVYCRSANGDRVPVTYNATPICSGSAVTEVPLRPVEANQPQASVGPPTDLGAAGLIGQSQPERGEMRPAIEVTGERSLIADVPPAELSATAERVYDRGRWSPGCGATGAVILVRDESDRCEVEAQLHEMNRRKDEFLATLAHELRNPLAPIRNGVELLKLSRGDPQIVAEVQPVIERQLRHVVRLVDDLLDVSRISRGKLELRMSTMSLADVVCEAITTLRPQLDAARHRLRMETPCPAGLIHGDQDRVLQLVSNLIHNAIKYTPPGGQIDLRLTEEGGWAELKISDNGYGIEPDKLCMIFEMFNQGSREKEYGKSGLGVGLSLARRLAELHGGTIEVSSAGANQGSTFCVRLPLLPELRTPDDDRANDLKLDRSTDATGSVSEDVRMREAVQVFATQPVITEAVDGSDPIQSSGTTGGAIDQDQMRQSGILLTGWGRTCTWRRGWRGICSILQGLQIGVRWKSVRRLPEELDHRTALDLAGRIAGLRRAWSLILCLTCLGFLGAGCDQEDALRSPTAKQMQCLAYVYGDFLAATGKAPAQVDELQEHLRRLPPFATEALRNPDGTIRPFVSERDGEPLQIRWNGPVREMSRSPQSAIVWEKTGKKGHRLVAGLNGIVESVDEVESLARGVAE